VRQHRRTRQFIAATITLLTLLLSVAVGLFFYARQQLARATENLANSLAANAVTGDDGRDVAILPAKGQGGVGPAQSVDSVMKVT
jgi:Flp pilus assembly protein TadG